MNMKAMLSLGIILVLPVAAWAQTDGRIVISTPDDRGHLRKMTEELIALARAKDANTKVDLFLRQGEERAKEIEALQARGMSSYNDALARSYDQHVSRGACGAIENGAFRGTDMMAACGRYEQA